MGMKLPKEIEATCLKTGKVQTVGVRLLSHLRQEDEKQAAMKALSPPDTKHGNIPVYHDDIFFQSTKEGDRYLILKDDLRRGKITDLQAQVTFEFVVNGVKLPQTYRADFVYFRDGKQVVEDVKGHKTDLYKIKKALMLAVHGIEILET